MDGRTGRETERQTDRQTDIEHYIARTIAIIHSFPFDTFMFRRIFGIPNQPLFQLSARTSSCVAWSGRSVYIFQTMF